MGQELLEAVTAGAATTQGEKAVPSGLGAPIQGTTGAEMACTEVFCCYFHSKEEETMACASKGQ